MHTLWHQGAYKLSHPWAHTWGSLITYRDGAWLTNMIIWSVVKLVQCWIIRLVWDGLGLNPLILANSTCTVSEDNGLPRHPRLACSKPFSISFVAPMNPLHGPVTMEAKGQPCTEHAHSNKQRMVRPFPQTTHGACISHNLRLMWAWILAQEKIMVLRLGVMIPAFQSFLLT